MLSTSVLSTLTLSSVDEFILTTLSTVTLTRLFDPTINPSTDIALIRLRELTRIQTWLIDDVFPGSARLSRIDFSFNKIVNKWRPELGERTVQLELVKLVSLE